MKFWFDTEFIEDGKTIDLISIGVIAEDGRKFYSESLDCDYTKANSFVLTEVIPHLNLLLFGEARSAIRRSLREFVEFDDTVPEFWTYFGSYDWVVLAQLFGTMMDFPLGWPQFPMDCMQLAVELGTTWQPKRRDVRHNALEDAIWTKDYYDGLMKLRGLTYRA